jgi:hypothetical protein
VGLPPATGDTRSTNRSPNNVFGNNRADTPAGTRSTCPGSNANPNLAPVAVTEIEDTRPMINPRSFTSEPTCSCDPIRSVNNVTPTVRVKAWAYEATHSPTVNATVRRKPMP